MFLVTILDRLGICFRIIMRLFNLVSLVLITVKLKFGGKVTKDFVLVFFIVLILTL